MREIRTHKPWSDKPNEGPYILESELPCVVLFTLRPYKFVNLSFKCVSHQTAGVMCWHKQLYGVALEPKPVVADLASALEKQWFDSNVYMPSLGQAVAYSRTLAKYGLSCDNSYRNMQEAFYPIDLTSEALEILSDSYNTLDVGNLDDLIDWSGHSSSLGSFGRWNLAILGPNSD